MGRNDQKPTNQAQPTKTTATPRPPRAPGSPYDSHGRRDRRLPDVDPNDPTRTVEPGAGGIPGQGEGPVELEPTADAFLPPRFMLLEVPNYNGADATDAQMGSYLRLGSIQDPYLAGSPYAPKSTGEDLASLATFFLDDERKRDGCPGFVSVEDRKKETARLHFKGGWRDHSDGNRISTTRGDKVEVIRGNYKMLVLGRQDEGGGGAGWDVSGGHIEGTALRSSIEWVQTWDGTWKTIETSEKGDTDITQHGNNVSRNFGAIQSSTTGSEDEQRPSTDAYGKVTWLPSANPVITDRTWARRIESYTGSAAKRVPLTYNETWADTVTSKTNAHTLSDETNVDTMSNTTIAKEMTAINLVGQTTNVTIGNMTNLTIGPSENLTIGAMMELTLSLMLQVCVSGSLSINVGPRREYNLSQAEGMAALKQDLAVVSTRVSAAADTVVAAVHSVTAAVINLG